MALVKQEEIDQDKIESDSWLSYWTNNQQKVKEEHEKLYKSDIKKEEEDIGSNESETHFDEKLNDGDKKKKGKGKKLKGQKHLRLDSDYCSKSNIKKRSKSTSTIKQKSFISISSDCFKKNLENSAVSENVESLCLYQCPICNAVYQECSSLMKHARKSKCSSNSKISIYSCLITTVVHQCGICSQKVLCDRHIIRKHLRSHKILSLAKYSVMCNFQNKSRNVNTKEEFDQFCLTYSGKIELSTNIGNLCLFSCKKCEFSSQRWGNMAKHLNACEKIKARCKSTT